ncbi:condensation domain-containing protein [Micromonospora sp. NPDC051196]|uniref:condensation domain-containing protein n=1 Tax=Micromonospora sp. NPDC051196 TaxID=3155281 RepID=UPI003420DBB2
MESNQLTFGQLSVWRNLMTLPRRTWTSTILSSLTELPGCTSGDVMTALGALCQRHEGLRTSFVETAGAVEQVVHPNPDGAVEIIAVDGYDDVERLTRELRSTPFTLTGDFGWRAYVMRMARRRTYVALAMQHIIVDRWALQILLEELRNELTSPSPNLRPDLPLSGLARQQRSAEWSRQRAQAKSYWQRVADEFGGITATGRYGDRRVRGSIDLPSAPAVVSEVSRVCGASAQSVMLALVALGIHASDGRDQFVIHLIAANRYRPTWRGLITSMAQSIPIGVTIDPGSTFVDLARTMSLRSLQGLRNGCYDVDEVAELAVRVSGGRRWEYVYNHLAAPWSDMNGAVVPSGVRAGPVIGPSSRPSIADMYCIVPRSEIPALEFHVDASRCSDKRLRRMLVGSTQVLRALAKHPSMHVGELSDLY